MPAEAQSNTFFLNHTSCTGVFLAGKCTENVAHCHVCAVTLLNFFSHLPVRYRELSENALQTPATHTEDATCAKCKKGIYYETFLGFFSKNGICIIILIFELPHKQ